LGYAGLCALLPNWKMEHEFLSNVPAQALQQSLKNLERAYTNFFQKRADFPKFKKKGQRESFRIPQGFEADNQNGRIKLPKLGWMRYRKSQDILGEASNVTVSESCGKWLVSIQTEREIETPQHPSTSAVGMDWGIVNFVTLSDGEVVDQCQPLKKFLPKVAKWQRRMARKKKFSKNWHKAKACIAKLHTKVANIRKDFVHKGLEQHQQKPRRCLYRRPASQEHEQVSGKEDGTKVWAEPFNLGRQSVRVAPSTGIQDAMARWFACPCASTEHESQVPRVRTGISREPQDTSEVCLRRMRILGQCGLCQCCEYQRGGSRLASLFATFG
jgi:hypothetical protein